MSTGRFSWRSLSRLRWIAVSLICAWVGPTQMLGQFDLGKLNDALERGKSIGKMAKGVVGIGIEEERALGGSVAAEIIARHGGIVRDEAITERVNLLGRSLAFYSGRPSLEWRFGVLDSATINAFSAPSGYVFITRGLYEQVANDPDALAAVLAHEIAHITERHALKIVGRAEFLSGATALAADRSSDVRQVQQTLAQFDLGVEEVVRTLLEKGFDPATEYAADAAGRELAVTTGYAPGALVKVLRQLQQSPSAPKAVFSTHPPLADRIKRLPSD